MLLDMVLTAPTEQPDMVFGGDYRPYEIILLEKKPKNLRRKRVRSDFTQLILHRHWINCLPDDIQ